MLFRNLHFPYSLKRLSVGNALSAVHSLLTRRRWKPFSHRSDAEEILEALKARYVREMTKNDDVPRSDPPADVYITLPLSFTDSNALIREENERRNRDLLQTKAVSVSRAEIKRIPLESRRDEISRLAAPRFRDGAGLPAQRRAEAVSLLC